MAAKTRTTTAIRFPVELHARLSAAAEERDISMNELVVACCDFGHRRLAPKQSMFRADEGLKR